MESSMPASRAGTSENGTNRQCIRCRQAGSVTIIRSEPLCKECFRKYIHMKTAKRMESFRVRNAPSDGQRRVILPLSLGISSVTLLHVLDIYLAGQINRTGRTGFDIVLLWIDLSPSSVHPQDPALLEKAKRMFPRHTAISASIEDIWPEILSSLRSDSVHDASMPSLPEFLSALPSSTSRADVLEHFKKRLAISTAKKNHCEAILWGHTATRLAEQTLAETAKGRGFSLSGQVSDGDASLGIPFYYPLRDLFRKEIAAYAEHVENQLSPFLDPPAKKPTISARGSSIDALMTSYIDSVESGYPSIVANVVRTAGEKLTSRPEPTSTKSCIICLLPYDDDDTETTSKVNGDTRQTVLCYGCRQSVPVACLNDLFRKTPALAER